MSNLACAEATCLWLTENFTDCHATLQKIESETKADLKLAHNLLVVEQVLAGGTDSERIASQLELIANDRLAAEDGAAADVVASSSRSRSSGVLEALPLVPVRDDLAVAQLNRAILLYRQHRYASAAELLEPLAANAEALAEGTAVRCLTLLLDIYIEGRQLPRAVTVLHTLERLYGALTEAYGTDRPGGGSAGCGAAGAPGGAVQGCGSGPGGAQQPQPQLQPQPGGGGVGAGPCSSGGSGSGGGWRAPRSLALPRVSRWSSGAVVRSRELLEQQARPLSVPDLKLLIRLYRSRLHALAHNTRAAKRELQAVIAALTPPPPPPASGAAAAATPAPGGALVVAVAAAAGPEPGPHGPGAGAGWVSEVRAGSPAASSLLVAVRAQLELYRGRVRKATKLLLGLMQDPLFADTHRPLLLNNLGLVHHQQGKHTLALLYLSQALAAAAAAPAGGSGRGSGPSPPGNTGPVQAQPPATHQGQSQQQQPLQTPAAAAAATATRGGGSGGGGGGEQAAGPGPGAPAAAASSSSAVSVPSVMYNAGLQQLMLGNHQAARGCFAAAASHYFNTPLLWLRTAEAALGLYRRTHKDQVQAQHPHSGQPSGHVDAQPQPPAQPPRTTANGPTTRPPSDAAPVSAQLRPPQQPPPHSAASTGPSSGTGGGVGGAGAGSRPGEEEPGSVTAGELLSEAIVALQTALQLLDAQTEEHEQWQSSSSKLEEGVAPPPDHNPGVNSVPAALFPPGPECNAAGTTNGSAQAPAQAPPPPPPAAPPGEPSSSLPPGSDLQPNSSSGHAVGQQQQEHLRQGPPPQPGHLADQQPHQQPTPPSSGQAQGQMVANGVSEPHGTDASVALSEELRAVRRAVLANLSYAHLQAGDWCSALAAARALMDLTPHPPIPSTPATATPPTSQNQALAKLQPQQQQPAAGAAAQTGAADVSGSTSGGGGGTADGGWEAYSFLATSYAAEALCRLDRPGDAVECLSLWLMAAQEREAAAVAAGGGAAGAQAGARSNSSTKSDEDNNSGSGGLFGRGSGGGGGGGGGYGSSAAGTTGVAGAREEVYPLGNASALAALVGPAALASTYTNLAAVFASQGELAQAAGLVRQALALQPGSGPAALLLVYCELAAGNTAAALALLKRGQPAPL